MTPSKLRLGLRGLVLLAFFCGLATVAPVLRLSTSALVWTNGSENSQQICADNVGDGTLALKASFQSGAQWFTVSVGAVQKQACSGGVGQSVPLYFGPVTTEMSPGTYTAIVTISDPNAIDAPQVVTATVQAGATAIDQYMPPGTQAQVSVSDYCRSSFQTSTTDGGTWLSLVQVTGNIGTFGFPMYECVAVHAILAPPANMAPGTYSGSLTANGYSPATIPVTMHLTTQPIAVPSVSQFNLQLAQGGPPMAYPFLPAISFTNAGMGTLQVQGVSASGVGVSASQSGQLAMVTIDPDTRGPGTYTDGLVTIQCNGANCPLTVPVSLEIVPKGPPTITGGVLDNVTFTDGAPIAPGDVCVIRGSQFSSAAPAYAAELPLPTSLGGSTVLVNGVLAPLYYSSSGQIAFQMPYSTAAGIPLVQVVRDGQLSNTGWANVVPAAPQIVAVTDSAYQLRDADHPTKAGETIILWAIGLGATNPLVREGAAAPVNPPALLANPSIVYSLLFGRKQWHASDAQLCRAEWRVGGTVPGNHSRSGGLSEGRGPCLFGRGQFGLEPLFAGSRVSGPRGIMPLPYLTHRPFPPQHPYSLTPAQPAFRCLT